MVTEGLLCGSGVLYGRRAVLVYSVLVEGRPDDVSEVSVDYGEPTAVRGWKCCVFHPESPISSNEAVFAGGSSSFAVRGVSSGPRLPISKRSKRLGLSSWTVPPLSNVRMH